MLSATVFTATMLAKFFKCQNTDIVAKIKKFSFRSSEPILISHHNEETESCEIPTPAMTSINTSQVIHSNHVNKDKILDGGQLLKWVDTCACLSAERLAGFPCVTVSVDDLYFNREVKLGQVINLSAQVNRAFRTSMEVGVRVTCEDLQVKALELVCEAFITFVALHPDGRKVKLPQVLCRTAEEQLVFSLANERRKVRIGYANTLKLLLNTYESGPLPPSSPERQDPSSPADSNTSLGKLPFHNSLHSLSVPLSSRHASPFKVVDAESTRVESVELVLPPHANHHGNTFGGQIMAWMENVASISAGHLCSGVATLRSVDMVYFRAPSTVGDRIILKSVVNNVFQNSLEVGVRVEAYRYDGGKIGPTRHINSAFLTYDIKGSSTVKSLPAFGPELVEGERRVKEAVARRKMRLDRRYILSRRFQDALSVKWSEANSLYLCYGNVKSLTRMATYATWQRESSNGNMSLCAREEEGVLSFCATLTMTESFKTEKIFNILRNPRLRPEWDPLMISCELVLEIGKEDGIYHTVMHSGSVQSSPPNDFVLLISDRHPASLNEPYRVAFRSVTLDSVPTREEFVRTEVACAGFVIGQQGGICTEISYYNETNPQMVNYITRDLAGLGALYCQVWEGLLEFINLHHDLSPSSLAKLV